MNEQMKYGEIWYLHTGIIEDYPVFRKDEILSSEKTRVNQENITVGDIDIKAQQISLICRI